MPMAIQETPTRLRAICIHDDVCATEEQLQHHLMLIASGYTFPCMWFWLSLGNGELVAHIYLAGIMYKRTYTHLEIADACLKRVRSPWKHSIPQILNELVITEPETT